MWSGFVSGISGKLSENLLAALFAPAFIFWASGLALALTCHELPGWARTPVVDCGDWSWRRFGEWFGGLSDLSQIMLLVGLLILVTASGAVLQVFALQVLRWLEGYWPSWLAPARNWLVGRKVSQYRCDSKRWDQLAKKRLAGGIMNPEERYEFNVLDRKLTSIPSEYVDRGDQLVLVPSESRIMPTQLGNLFRAVEFRPQLKYGLDAIVCWPRLWLVLPEDTKKEITQARSSLDTTATAFCWSVLFIVWGIFTWLAVPIGIGAAILAYHAILVAAGTYGALVEAGYDVHRLELYKVLRWPLPNDHNPLSEVEAGKRLTQYLLHTYRRKQPVFTAGQQDESSAPDTSASKPP